LKLSPVLLLILLALSSLSLSRAEEESRMEFRMEAGQLFTRQYLKLTNEHWPGTIEVFLYEENGKRRDSASLAFSLENSPHYFEEIRVGIAVDAERIQQGWVGRKVEPDDRVYLYVRSDLEFCRLHLRYPFAKGNHGHEWYWSIVAEDLSLDLGDGFSLVADLDYSPEYGLRDSCGFGYENAEWYAVVGTDRFSVGWGSTTDF